MTHILSNTSFFSGFKVLLFLVLLVSSGCLSAQQLAVTSGKGIVYAQFDGRVDYLVMMHDISVSSEISVILPDASLSVNWHRYPDNQFVSNQKSISPDDHTGYVVTISGSVNGQAYNQQFNVWVIDYKLYQPVLNSLTAPDPTTSGCSQLTLTLDAQIPEMYYWTTNGLKYTLEREFNMHYETLEWDDEWVSLQLDIPVVIENNTIEITNPPYKNTYFTLSGDQFASDLVIDLATVQSSFYQAIRVISKIKTEATVRVEKNEGDRPDNITTLSGSAPLEINFSAIANSPVADYFKWEISTAGGSPFIVRTGESHRYTFTEAGTYSVKLHAENAYCNHTDSVVIRVSESALYAPNVFTPNGDGINDEFRVAYKSIVEFDCWIFNRWGSKMFHFTDPQKGWDGTVNGRPANEGAYFYVIKARGADGIVYNLKGDINLLRGKQH